MCNVGKAGTLRPTLHANLLLLATVAGVEFDPVLSNNIAAKTVGVRRFSLWLPDLRGHLP